MMSCNKNNKVNNYTQVDQDLVEADFRSIVGQEDGPVDYLSKSLTNMSLRNQNKEIRPPLVGQASSSSNDSVSHLFDGNNRGNNLLNVSNTQNTSPIQTIFANNERNQISGSRESKVSSYLLNREDYVNQRPPEGSSSLISMIVQPVESAQEFSRVRSSSSASSVTSSKPLEWDNGADVGYSQSYIISGRIKDSKMSTVERMALVCSTNLLTRSEPEGTTGGQCQQVINSSQPRIRTKNKFPIPKAESTPLLGTCVTSDASPEAVDIEFISPILHESSEAENISEFIVEPCGENIENPTQKDLIYSQENCKRKVPLFPEIGSGLDDCLHNKNRKGNKRGECDEDVFDEELSKRKHVLESQILNQNFSKHKLNEQQFSSQLKSKLESLENNYRPTFHKKLSSSLENIYNLNNALLDHKSLPFTLPRSQSQLDLNAEKVSVESNENTKGNSNAKPNLQSLIHYKSASSSSVATVVQRKGDSPKHALIQTSLLNKESVGIQVYESINRNNHRPKVFTGISFSETPHLPKAVLTHEFIKRSNYFDFNEIPKNDVIDNRSVVGQSNDVNLSGERSKTNEIQTHFHNGIQCKGAHRRNFRGEISESKGIQQNLRSNSNNGISTNTSIRKNKPTFEGRSASKDRRKMVNNTNLDSVESSTKSGGCGTDKQYSVTVEDRVNSFEYLPGHVYEKGERQQPVNSCGTSSISIDNQTSNNVSPEDQNKIWESSGSLSSTFEKDVQRGVDMLSDFVKGTCENDSILKRKLVRRVIDKLISKNYVEGKIEYKDLMKNMPWVPPRPPNPIERNNRKTEKSKVPCELSSRSEKSESSNASSECFIPRPAANNMYVPQFLQDKACKKDRSECSSSSNVTLKKLSKYLEKPPDMLRNKHVIEESPNSSSSKVLQRSNWKEPVTKTEKLVEERKKIKNESSSNQENVSVCAKYLNLERENQLFWIRSEIDHLSNLKLLLEKQEELKRGLKNLKPRHGRSSQRAVLKDQNRVEKGKVEASTSQMTEVHKNKSSLKTKESYSPKLSDWLQDSVAKSKAPQDTEMEDWASHQYENNENIKSCLKRKKKLQTQKSLQKSSSETQNVIYDEPPLYSYKKKQDLNHYRRSSTPNDNQNASTSTTEKDGVQTSPLETDRSRQKLREPEQYCQCLCQGMCQCCSGKNDAKTCKEDKKKKAPIGYYIIFECPKEKDKSKAEQIPLEENGIPFPVGEQKNNPRRQLGEGLDDTNKKRGAGLDVKTNCGKKFDIVGSEVESTSSESENRNDDIPQKKQIIFKGGAGELQYHLLHNRPSYVSRAEDRRECIAQMQYLRELSNQSKQRLLSLTQRDHPTQARPPLPLPTKMRRVFSQHTMRQMTEKKYRQLSEVREKLQDTKKKESYRTNRLMAEIFKKNLQKRVLKGEVNLSNSVYVISSL